MANEANSGITKRSFLQQVGMIGGSAAVFTAMRGLELAHASAASVPPEMTNSGNGKKIIILGAGLAGLTLAYELSKKGYDYEIIEARSFVGGRCQSARKGSVIEEIGGETQVCKFEDNQYLNIGPWRIPAEHKATIYYCNKVGAKLEPMLNKSVHAIYYSENIEGSLKGVRLRQIEADIDRAGNIAELLAKTAKDGLLDEKLSEEDVERLISHLGGTGLLDRRSLNYRANRARGFAEYPGAAMDRGKLSDPYDFSEMLKVKVGTLYHTADHPAVMFQAVGGMDQIAFGLRDQLRKSRIKLNSEVTKIIQSDDNVEITYKSTKSGKERTVSGDYCISTIPYPVFGKIETNLNPELADALNSAGGAPAYKIGLQMNYRFWEKDEMIYGGSSYSDLQHHGETSYPSSDLHSDKGGVILGNYFFARSSIALSNMSNADRVEHALAIGEKLHPGKYRKYFNGNAISKAWHKDKYALAGAPRASFRKLPKILEGDKRVLFSGDGTTVSHSAWMTGAFEGAWYTMAELDKRVAKS